MVHALDQVSGLADAELVGRLEQLVRSDRALSAQLLVHLGEVKARRLYLERGFSSMFEYCRSGLGMSEAEAGLRILAAGVGREFPLVVEQLAAGAVHLTAIKLLAPHLTAENHVQLLERARGMTKRQIEVLVADLAPKPEVPARIRKLPEKRSVVESRAAAKAAAPSDDPSELAAGSGGALMAAESETAGVNPAAGGGAALTDYPAVRSEPLRAGVVGSSAQPSAAGVRQTASASAFALQSPRARASSTPLGRGRFELRVTLGQEAQVALDQLVELLRHQNPSGNLACIVERALCELLQREMKRRFGHSNAPEKRATSMRAPAATAEPRVMREPARAEAADLRVMREPARAEAADRRVMGGPARAEAAERRVMGGPARAEAAERRVMGGPARAEAAERRVMGGPARGGLSELGVACESAPAELGVEGVSGGELGLSRSRYVARAVLREVYARDDGQCTYVSPEGRRCAERGFLEVHHHNTTFARGGEASAENLRLACRAHNGFYAERDYGRAFMQGKLDAGERRHRFQERT